MDYFYSKKKKQPRKMKERKGQYRNWVGKTGEGDRERK